MKETPFFFPNGRHELFGILHEPAGAPSSPAFVFCHPFGEEKLWTHRVFVTFARRLAEVGHAVLRFDFTGNGDSEGAFSESSLGTMKADVHRAIHQVRQMTGATGVGLLGLRLGATVASLVAEEVEAVDRLVLWAPIVDGRSYMQDLLRINLTTQMAVFKEIRHDREALESLMAGGNTINVDGYDLSFPLYAEVSATTLAARPRPRAGSILIVQIDRQPRPARELRQLADAYGDATIAFAQEEPFWREIARSYQQPAANLFSVTTDWMRKP